MAPYLIDWLAMLLRWLHVITGIAWIGASFYFVWLDNHLERPEDPDLKAKGVDGELWAVHGGGFYHPQKYLTAPKRLPSKLHWFYWESYSTWMSGFALFVVLYLTDAKAYLIDPQVHELNAGQAVLAALGFLVLGWVVYDGLCRLLGFRERLLGVAVALYIAAATYGACHLFAGRAAFLIVGAMMATMMSANVLFWIIPGQRKVVAALARGEAVDPLHGKRGKQRSVHNTYLTLPVLFCMLSNHFGRLHAQPRNWLALVLMMAAGVMIRQFFLLRHRGELNLWYPSFGLGLLAAVGVWLQPPSPSVAPATAHVDDQAAFAIVTDRCHGCHAQEPTLMGGGAPKGIAFESVADVRRHAAAIYKQAVELKVMPLGNITHITDGEREALAQWYSGHAGH